jgi:hypothetical protein
MLGPLDEAVRSRIVAEARGNPLALLELSAWAMVGQLGGRLSIPGGLPLPRRIEVSCRRRVERLPN